MIVAAVIGAAAWNEIGELLLADEIAATHFDARKADRSRHLVDCRFNGVVRRRLTEAAHGFLHRLVGGDRLRAVLHALDLVRTDDGADRLAQLERRTSGIGAGIVERANLHRLDDAVAVERDIDVEDSFRTMRITAAHVLQSILDEAHGATDTAGKMRHENGSA